MTTRDNRASAIGIALAFRLVLPEPGTITQPDQQHVAYSYRGITAAAATLAEPVLFVRVRARPTTVRVRNRPTTILVTEQA